MPSRPSNVKVLASRLARCRGQDLDGYRAERRGALQLQHGHLVGDCGNEHTAPLRGRDVSGGHGISLAEQRPRADRERRKLLERCAGERRTLLFQYRDLVIRRKHGRRSPQCCSSRRRRRQGPRRGWLLDRCWLPIPALPGNQRSGLRLRHELLVDCRSAELAAQLSTYADPPRHSSCSGAGTPAPSGWQRPLQHEL